MISRFLLLATFVLVAAVAPTLAQPTCLEGRPPSVDFGKFEADKTVSRAIDVFNKSNGQATISEVRLTSGTNGFQLQPRILPIFMPPQGLATITVDAFGTDTSKVYRDTLFIRADCGSISIPLAFSTSDKQSGPQISGFDFGSQWVTQGNCTKNPANEYTGRVGAFNTGDAEMIVQSVRILGADAAFFALGTDGSSERINQGDRIASATSTDTARRYQTVLFRPGPAERAYSAVIEITTSDAKTSRATLRGTGTESHMTLSEDTLKSTLGTQEPKAILEFTANFTPTRPTTISNVVLSPAGPFTLETPRGEIVKTFQPGENVRIRVGFNPDTSGTFPAKITLSGNFSSCGDSTVAFVGTGIIRVSAPDESASFSVSEPMPNPVTGSATVTVTLVQSTSVRMDLIDARGHVVRTITHDHLPSGANRLQLDLSQFASGAYTLRTSVGDDAHVVTRAIVVVH